MRLIQTRCVSTSKMLVLDEPEIHLHPEWQISFCRIIIELVANGVPIVVSSHSPYFIQGLRYLAAAKGVEKDVTYYMAEQNEDGLSTFNDVTDDLNKVFTLLAAPLHEIICVRSTEIGSGLSSIDSALTALAGTSSDLNKLCNRLSKDIMANMPKIETRYWKCRRFDAELSRL